MSTLIGKKLGQFEVVELLGQGGMATVYKAYQPALDRFVAIKVFPASPTGPTFLEHFTREARAVAKLYHPHILPIHDFGEQDGTTYIVMEYVSGGTLKRRLKPNQPMPLRDALDVVLQACQALECAHQYHIVHRDIKPGNLLLRSDHFLLLSDLGIAQVLEAHTALTRTGVAPGTPQYLSPEQSTGSPDVGPRSDLYSLGVVLYEAVAGRVPFGSPGDDPHTISLKQVNEPLPPPRQFAPDLPTGVEQVIVKALEKDPDQRFQSATEMIDALNARILALRGPSVGFSSAFQAVALAHPPSASPSEEIAARPLPPVEALRFTAFYPKEVAVEAWNTLLVYTHIASALSAVRTDAARYQPEIGERPREAASAAARPVVRGTTLTVVPQAQGVTFNPPHGSFQWLEDWQRTSFRFLATSDLNGFALTGEISIYAGPLLLSTIKMPLLCQDTSPAPSQAPDAEATAPAYQQVFASYSHQDTPVVLACRNAYQALGLKVLIDLESLRSGQDFSRALMRLIERSDIFQLFWSPRAAASAYVHREWEYALALGKSEGFIRPVYWELPLVPPPAPLANLHFKFIPLPQLPGAHEGAADGTKCFRCSAVNLAGKLFCTTCGYDLSGRRAQNDRALGPSGRPYYARFSMMNGPLGGRHFTLHQDTTTIGRTTGNDIIIPDISVSRQHAVLRFEQGKWVVEDKNSANGTYVNGARIRGPQTLSEGDQLRFGDEVVLFNTVQ
jgi:hypothetical protein